MSAIVVGASLQVAGTTGRPDNFQIEIALVAVCGTDPSGRHKIAIERRIGKPLPAVPSFDSNRNTATDARALRLIMKDIE